LEHNFFCSSYSNYNVLVLSFSNDDGGTAVVKCIEEKTNETIGSFHLVMEVEVKKCGIHEVILPW